MKNSFKTLIALLLVIIAVVRLDASTNADFIKLKLGGAYCTIADKFGGETTLKELQNIKQIGIAGCAQGSKIYSFALEITKNGRVSTFNGSSHKLTQQILNNLKSLKSGDSFVFRKMKAHLPNGENVDVMGKPFVVVKNLE